MPLIHAIEVSSFMNHRRISPWRPDWRYQRFTMCGLNTAINIPNGRGKSSLILSILSMLSWHTRALKDLRLKHFAAPDFGLYTHVRIEITLRAPDQEGLFDDVTGPSQGEHMVFGIYGNAGENGQLRFYSYRGGFDDCPLATINGSTVTLTSNEAFLDRLTRQDGHFPSTERERTHEEWRRFVGENFDLSSIQQQLTYQLASGAEGSNNYFTAPANRAGSTYGAELFYKHLAPELLTEVMGTGDQGEESENGIEELIHQRAKGVVQANRKTEQTRKDLADAERVLEAFRRIDQLGSTMQAARQTMDKHTESLSVELAALRNVLEENPVPGVPRRPASSAPAFYENFFLQQMTWFLSDRTLGQITGEDAKVINQRAERNKISARPAINSQVIDFSCDHGYLNAKRIQGGGPSSQIYNRDAAIALIGNSSNFAAPWTRETSLKALTEGFLWAEETADTNPVRQELRAHRLKLNELGQELLRTRDRSASLTQSREKAETALTRLQNGKSAWDQMYSSGLFSHEELSAPANTGKCVESEKTQADKDYCDHLALGLKLKPLQDGLAAFYAELGHENSPGAVAVALEVQHTDAKAACNDARSVLLSCRQERDRADLAFNLASQSWITQQRDLGRIEELSGPAQDYARWFSGVDPIGLEAQVKAALTDKIQARQACSEQLATLQHDLASLEHFALACPGVSPEAWLAEQKASREAIDAQHKSLLEEQHTAYRMRQALEHSAVAAGEVALRVMELAGAGAQPLHEFVVGLGLEVQRQESMLTLFSALLFSPVFDDLSLAGKAARRLSDARLEAPVFLSRTLAQFCHGGEVTLADGVAAGLIVGVRTRAVDCLLDPELVARERETLDTKLARLKVDIPLLEGQLRPDTAQQKLEATARRAADAVLSGVEEKAADLRLRLSQIDACVPALAERASDTAIEAIRAILHLNKLLAGRSLDECQAALASAKEALELAQSEKDRQENAARGAEKKQDACNEALQIANEQVGKCPQLKALQSYMDDTEHGPAFMAAYESQAKALETEFSLAVRRSSFNFEEVANFIQDGGAARTLGLSQEIAHCDEEIRRCDSDIERIQYAQHEHQELINTLIPKELQVDGAIIQLRQRFKALSKILKEPATVSMAQLESHFIFDRAIDWRSELGAAEVAEDMQQQVGLLLDGGTNAQDDLRDAQRELHSCQKALSDHIDDILRRPDLKLAEIVRTRLTQTKEDPSHIKVMLEQSEESYSKNVQANLISAEHLDKEWNSLAEWLQNFTRRLPSNFAMLKRAFAPKDTATPSAKRAGFIIEGTLVEPSDIRSILEGLVHQVQQFEDKFNDFDGLSSTLRAQNIKSLRHEIRDVFYRGVIKKPRIKLFLPAMSHGPIEMAPNMASSGQGVAITFLWILKLADYINEREISRYTVSSAQRRTRRKDRSSFTILDGAFSHLSDRALIDSALDGIEGFKGQFQLIVTGHEPNYKNDFRRFPCFIAAREMTGHYMRADSYGVGADPNEVGSLMENFHTLVLPVAPAKAAEETAQ